ncbi:hypothetical protein OG946_35875 [Streptomyces sp. NBC_01808]|uniref:hypothetical protein n=1 Tax=Streptomyces sp. NBC_01808 TaxID=2975947 RepID=UPI002DD9FB13|nr:hypothetical protein [Streptomyces sp. NBC_01808]WSA35918.1 hypothetical protein OG946_00115 [Streptomyces sp. NBC_01808]WSA42284.1 hypothetical protein OG946_35875 [Streptomyces sp. NBC_01808]
MADDTAEVTAAQAYRRLVRSVQAALAEPGGSGPAAAVVLAGPLADADRALAAAGLAGNEPRFFAVVRSVAVIPAPAPGPAPA